MIWSWKYGWEQKSTNGRETFLRRASQYVCAVCEYFYYMFIFRFVLYHFPIIFIKIRAFVWPWAISSRSRSERLAEEISTVGRWSQEVTCGSNKQKATIPQASRVMRPRPSSSQLDCCSAHYPAALLCSYTALWSLNTFALLILCTPCFTLPALPITQVAALIICVHFFTLQSLLCCCSAYYPGGCRRILCTDTAISNQPLSKFGFYLFRMSMKTIHE